MSLRIATVGLAVFLGACGYVSEYEKAVYALEPTYCYKSIGKVACYREPFHRDERRLVNYFGPDPSRYDKPDAPEATPIAAPEIINYWVKDAEPVPRPAAVGNVSNLPWLDPAVAKASTGDSDFQRLSAGSGGTRALLERMGIGPHGQLGLSPARPAPGPDRQAARASGQPASEPAPEPASKAQPKPPVVEVEVDVN